MVDILPLSPSGQTDPRALLAQGLLNSGQAGTVGGGINSAVSNIVGALLAKKAFDQQQANQTAAGNVISQALTTALGRPAEQMPLGPESGIRPDEEGFRGINFDAQPGNPRGAIAQLLSNPQTANSGLTQALLGQALTQPAEIVAGGQAEALGFAPGTVLSQSSGQTKVLQQPQTDRLLSPEEEAQKVRIAQASRPQINIDNSGNQLPDPPTGTVYGRNPDGSVAFTTDPQTGLETPIAVPIAGSKLSAERGTARQAKAQRENIKLREAQNVVQTIGRLRGLVSDETFLSPATGLPGSLVSAVPGTRAFDAKSLVDTVKANVGFNKLQAMREASPTGGALGQVSERENILLQSTIQNLEQSQSQAQFLENLAIVEETFLDVVHGEGNRPGRFATMNEEQLIQVDINTLTPSERKEMERRFDELGLD